MFLVQARRFLTAILAGCLAISLLVTAPAHAQGPTPSSQVDVCDLYPSAPAGLRDPARSTGVKQFVNIYLDFSDAPGSASPISIQDYVARWEGETERFTNIASYGRLGFEVTHLDDGWVRMPRPAAAYQDGGDWQMFISDAGQAIAAAGLDLSTYDHGSLFMPPDTGVLNNEPPMQDGTGGSGHAGAYPGQRLEAVAGSTVSGLTIYGGNTGTGFDGYRAYGERLYLHENIHLMGVEDLYAYPDFYDANGDGSHFVGGWTLMGAAGGHAGDFLGFNKWRLGWLDQVDVECVTEDGTVTVTLADLQATSGTRLINLPVSNDGRSVALEYRTGTGLDENACASGVLAYDVNQYGKSGEGPFRVIDATPGTVPGNFRDPDPCLHRDIVDAPITPALGAVELGDGITVRVLSMDGTTAEVEISRGVPAPPGPTPAQVLQQAGITRIANSGDPVQAAVAIAQEHFQPADVQHVVVGREDVFADNLGGSALAGFLGGPLLLNPTAGLDDRVAVELRRLLPGGTGTVWLLGGEVALSPQVANDISALGYTVERLAGAGRVETSIAIAREIDSRTPSTIEVYIAVDNNFADSATGGALAAIEGKAILVNPGGVTHPALEAYLREIRQATFAGSITCPAGILGGAAAISAEVELELEALLGCDIPRLAGPSREATAVQIAETFVETSPEPVDGVAIVNGYDDNAWVYSLAGGATAPITNEPMLSANPGLGINDDTEEFLSRADYTLTAYGSEDVLTDGMLLTAAAEANHAIINESFPEANIEGGGDGGPAVGPDAEPFNATFGCCEEGVHRVTPQFSMTNGIEYFDHSCTGGQTAWTRWGYGEVSLDLPGTVRLQATMGNFGGSEKWGRQYAVLDSNAELLQLVAGANGFTQPVEPQFSTGDRIFLGAIFCIPDGAEPSTMELDLIRYKTD